jgi:hypothetical protein
MKKLRRILRRKYTRALFAGALDHAARRARVNRQVPSLLRAKWWLALVVESSLLHITSVALGRRRELAEFTAVLNKSLSIDAAMR